MEKRGGVRKGSGRKKGSTNKISLKRTLSTLEHKEYKTPLEVLLIVMNQCLTDRDYKLAIEAAKGAAPYVHVKKSEEAMVDKGEAQRLPPMIDYLAHHDIIVDSLK
ncbi:hypothetical protein COMNV_00452 [Commensalibacter sp. Nvir]|uniref:hypothetical protein n=1 Tax=Commensalibacter sp. Nvir TaxID=3069817 RepID=UPI002D5F60C9|nr:hypothetical protein COMNV_00452 [Commensalibacter sp. Nvir]